MNKFLHLFHHIMTFINRRLSEICGYLLLIIMILLTINVFAREIGYFIPGLNTLAVLVMIAVVYLGLSPGEQKDEHASVDMLPNVLPAKLVKTDNIIVNILKLITIGVFFYVSIGEVVDSYVSGEQFAGVVDIPNWPAKLALCLGLFFFAVQIVYKLVESMKSEKKERTMSK